MVGKETWGAEQNSGLPRVPWLAAGRKSLNSSVESHLEKSPVCQKELLYNDMGGGKRLYEVRFSTVFVT